MAVPRSPVVLDIPHDLEERSPKCLEGESKVRHEGQTSSRPYDYSSAMSEAQGGGDLMSSLDAMQTAEPLPADEDLAIRMNDSKLRGSGKKKGARDAKPGKKVPSFVKNAGEKGVTKGINKKIRRQANKHALAGKSMYE